MKFIIWQRSHVAVSLKTPEYTSNADGLGTLRILMQFVVRFEKKKHVLPLHRLYGKDRKCHNQKPPFYPRSPYAVAKDVCVLDNG
jgi:GDPmannose 4,6-dehydratase